MGLFSSSSKNTTNAYDQSQTSTINESVSGGDTDLDNSIFARNSDFSSVDNSTAFADNSYNDSSVRTASTDNRDSSNNSFNLDLSGSDYSQQSTSTTNITDGGAFSMINGVMGKVIDSLSGNQNKLVELVGLSQKSSLSASNDLVSRSMDAAATNKTVAEVISQDNGKIKLIAGAALVVAGLFTAYKFARGRK